ncbi:MAG: SUMF1/EgtB/PvdO family nonheme iron enzyme [Myxococcales bacterium]|nr:SUMF1/EgtB/PvdO family nonheme iron enzyme [Myxococcales bacterium]MBL0193651.1 SUMF1/EgtB/PvdO family nonheme iron enzyme [Myxococcales bacterium]
MKRSKFGALVFGFVVVSVWAGQSPPAVAEPSAPELSGGPGWLGITATNGLKLSTTPAPVDALQASCPTGMVEVEGDYCPALQQRCLRWLDPETKLRCAEFAPTGACQAKTVHKHFCMDRYEYPNKVGERPVIGTTWYESRDACKAQGKRLCLDSEWTLACEGQERLPYPYGYARNAEACNIDKPHPEPNAAAMFDPKRRAAEFARLDQRDPSGAREACVSPYGVSDMAGNVDEWVVNESGYPYKSGSKGGYWGPVRTRCRPMTTAHFEMFSFYQLGFRCCADAQTPEPSGPSPSVGLVGPRRLGVAASGRVALLPGS